MALSMELKRLYGQRCVTEKYWLVEVKGRHIEIVPAGSIKGYAVCGTKLKLIFSLAKNNIESGPATANEIWRTYMKTFRESVTPRYVYYFVTGFLDVLGCIETDRTMRPATWRIKGEMFSETGDAQEGLAKFYAAVMKVLGLKSNITEEGVK